jgi:Transposase DDE domain
MCPTVLNERFTAVMDREPPCFQGSQGGNGSLVRPDPAAHPRGMRRSIDRNRPLWPEPVIGGKYVLTLETLIRALRPQDAHGNRILHLDDVLVCYLLAFYNPALRSLRTIEDFSRTQQAQRYLSVDRIPKSTLSDFQRVADPALLDPIIALLRDHARRDLAKPHSGLPEVLGQVLAVDGSFFAVAADVAWAFKRRGGKSPKGGRPRKAVRLDVHLDVASWLPEVISVADGESEAAHAQATIVPGAVHVYDRGIFSFELVAAHFAAGAHFVHRLREPGPRTPRFEADEELPPGAADGAAGLLSDRLGSLAGSQHCPPPPQRLREVVIASPGQPGEQVRLLTDLFDIPAPIVGSILRNRWQVELFFRWLKSCGRFRGIWCEERSGVLLQFYVALIAMLLMYLRTGLRPSKYALNLLGMVAAGTATWEEVQPIIADRARERERERARLSRRKGGGPN